MAVPGRAGPVRETGSSVYMWIETLSFRLLVIICKFNNERDHFPSFIPDVCSYCERMQASLSYMVDPKIHIKSSIMHLEQFCKHILSYFSISNRLKKLTGPTRPGPTVMLCDIVTPRVFWRTKHARKLKFGIQDQKNNLRTLRQVSDKLYLRGSR